MTRTLPLLRLLLGPALLLLPAAGGAQTSPAARTPPCREAAFRAFDFWVGEWTVRNARGDVVGHNEISRIAEGCALLEMWTDNAGVSGSSINFHDRGLGAWQQIWVGGQGGVLRLEGGMDGESMQLTGRRAMNGSVVLDRIRWTPLEDGRVRQHWQISTDDGATWTDSFDGYYSRNAKSGAGTT
jgi:hypothetical protein